MQWIYNSRTGGTVPYLGTVPEQLELHSGLGWHGPFDSKDAAIQYYNANKAKNPGWKAPTSNPSTAINNAPDAAKDQTNAAVKGLGLTDQQIQTWLLRIGEILLGIVLLGVGVARLTGTSNVVADIMKTKMPIPL